LKFLIIDVMEKALSRATEKKGIGGNFIPLKKSKSEYEGRIDIMDFRQKNKKIFSS